MLSFGLAACATALLVGTSGQQDLPASSPSVRARAGQTQAHSTIEQRKRPPPDRDGAPPAQIAFALAVDPSSVGTTVRGVALLPAPDPSDGIPDDLLPIFRPPSQLVMKPWLLASLESGGAGLARRRIQRVRKTPRLLEPPQEPETKQVAELTGAPTQTEFIADKKLRLQYRGLMLQDAPYLSQLNHSALLARATPGQGEPPSVNEGAPPRQPPVALGMVQIFATYLGQPHNHWRGIDVMTDVDVDAVTRVAATVHHESRDASGTFGALSATRALSPSLALSGSVGVGNGAFFLPTAEVRGEISARLKPPSDLNVSAGIDSSWWSQGRGTVDVFGSIGTQLDSETQVELSQHLLLARSPDGPARAHMRTALAVSQGIQGSMIVQGRVALGSLPQNLTQADFTGPGRFYVDADIASRVWLQEHYGFVAGFRTATQSKTFFRVGVNIGFFYELQP